MKSATKVKKRPRLKRFWLFYGLLVAVLSLCSALFLSYVEESLRLFEAAQPKYFLDGVLESLRSLPAEELAETLDFPAVSCSRFDDYGAYRVELARRLLDSELSWAGGVEAGDGAYYELCSDGEKAAEITIRSVGRELRLGLMSIPEWELVGIRPVEPPLCELDIAAPSSFRVLVNGLELDERERVGETPIPGLEYEAEYVEVPVMVGYHIENLLAEPDVRAFDNLGGEVPVEADGNAITVRPEFAASEFPEELRAEVDVLKIAETWSSFLTRDLAGPLYGLEEARARFVKGSDFWNLAYDYATGVDITFVSGHSLVSFTNEAVTDYIRYSEKCFSCEVYFEKNMRLTRSGAMRTDVFNSRLFFVLYDDTEDGVDNPRWLISDMRAVTDAAG